MDYQYIVDVARRAKPLKRVVIPGGQTNGYVKCKVEPQAKAPAPKVYHGVDYAAKLQKQDEEEEAEEEKKAAERLNCMSMIEELTSIGTVPDINDLKEDLTQVYKNYTFDTKSDSTLLINNYKEEILQQMDVSPIVIIKGQTGCGKTTQVPQFILDHCASNTLPCNIAVTQPRKIAAISVAKRVCAERGWHVGSLVGYQIALDKEVSTDTRLMYCTTGVLLHQLIQKKNLNHYTHIVIDEVHERDQETDFLLIVVKKYLRQAGCRTKVILMSATINTNSFVDYFTKKVKVKIEPPVIELEHLVRFPVFYYYLNDLEDKVPLKLPYVQLENPCIDTNMYHLACTLVQAFHTIDQHEYSIGQEFIGSVLIFLPGLHEIEVMYETLSKKANSSDLEKWWLCPLHSSVTFDEQLKVFRMAPQGHRKIILATNIAESSITVPDVKYVIDFCLMKMQVQERETSYTSLQLAWISKSQSNQRAGRVGRVMPGRVYRLVPNYMYEDLTEDCSPEILRSPLDQLVLKAKSLECGSPVSILGRALDPPDLSNIHRTILYLKEMGALLMTTDGEYVEDDGDLTFIGRIMANLPLDTHLSKLIILGHMFSLLSDCVIMASAMSVKSMFSTPFKQQLEAYNSKLSWADSSCSDPIAFLNAYKVWRFKKNVGKFSRSGGASEADWAKRYYIQLQSMREVSRLESEIQNRLKFVGIMETQSDRRVTWEENIEKPLILKLIIAGAFYPNMFVRRQVNEKDAVKTLGGRDPFSTVYLTGLPINQPGPLYATAIKKKFEHCGSLINVSFDGSTKVYLQFGSSMLQSNANDHLNITMPGKIMMAVYRAIKLRHLQIPIVLHLLSPHDAEKRAVSLMGQSSRINTYCWMQRKKRRNQQSNLPGLSTNYLEINITHIESPSQFWVQLADDSWSQKLVWMHRELNRDNALVPLAPEHVKVGAMCVAPYTESDHTLFYRARIKKKPPRQSTTVEVFFVDYGNREWLSTSCLMDFADELVASGVKDEPEMCIECVLSEIQPSLFRNPKGAWSHDVTALFRDQFIGCVSIATVYSVVNSIMSLSLYKGATKAGVNSEMPTEKSFNAQLIRMGYAEFADEPYLSRENHIVRELAINSPETVISCNMVQQINEASNQDNIDIDSPLEKECRIKVTLKGPRSPLEMSLYSQTKKSQGMDVNVEWSSVNSVLLDTFPMDPHDRMLVAGSVTQSTSGDRITLRNTTMMPNIHGLCAIVAMIFAPKCELRVDRDRTRLVGVLCGLGADPVSDVPYNPDNDIELPFDTVFDLDDLENINRLRFWMNYIVHGGLKWEEEVSKPKAASAQNKIKEFILKILSKKRSSQTPQNSERPYRWGDIDDELMLHPNGGDTPYRMMDEVTIFPLIWGVQLNQAIGGDATVLQNLRQLTLYAEGKEKLRSGVMCQMCQLYLDTVQNIRLHLQTSMHREAKKQMFRTVPQH